MKFYLLEFFTFILIIKESISIEHGVKLGSKIDICCTIQSTQGDGLAILAGDIRIKMLIKGDVIEQDINAFKSKNPSYTVERKNDILCMVKEISEKEDDKFSFKCIILEKGFGKSLNEETHKIRIYEELKFIKKLNEKFVARVGEDLEEECSAAGSPDLKVIWRTESNPNVTSGSPTAKLQINRLTAEMNGMKYTCEASISIPKGEMGTINQSITLDIRFKPQIDIETLIIHTDLGFEETFRIKVKGNPQPKIDCPLLNIPAEKVMTITDTDQFSYIYQMTIDKITQQNIGTYQCNVENEEGKATKQVSLILKPANLIITSPNGTEFSSCYMLSWTMNSKSPITNFTITTKSNNNNSTFIRKTVKSSELSTFRKVEGIKKNKWLNEFSYIFFNLTSNETYTVTLQICNKHECIIFENGAFFRTGPSDGNKCDPDRLYSNLDLKNPKSDCRNIKPSLLFVCTQTIILFLVPLLLQQAF